MSDKPGAADSPFDSFSGRLGKALKKSEPGKPAQPPARASEPDAIDPTLLDSFARRLDKKKSDAMEAAGTESEPVAEAQTSEEAPLECRPVGSGEHVVRQGECVSSIAENAGHFWETIWNDPANSALREARKDPNVLLPADRVFVPPLREKWESRPTEMRHRFRRRGWPEVFRVRVLQDGEPRGNTPYVLSIDGVETTGVTDANGNLARPIEPNARKAILTVGAEPDVTRYEFTLGAIDPIESISGVQGRLKNLGFDCGAVDGKMGPRTQAALRDYQHSRGLEETGNTDDATRRRLQSDYGC